ncbi:MAG TPA: hypothetical protein VKA84_17565 [Gemmatimonadaceae bacterium]|nr:hypothetical protein [Gemmatimonadaceae bacterium]
MRLRRQLLPFPVRPLLAAGLALLVSCGKDGQQPEPELAGAYELTAVDGKPLPHTFWCPPLGMCMQVTGGRIEGMSRGRVREILATQGVGSAQPPVVDTLVSTYTLEGTRLIMSRSRDYGSVYTFSDTATLESGQLRYKSHYIGLRQTSGGTFQYVKQ